MAYGFYSPLPPPTRHRGEGDLLSVAHPPGTPPPPPARWLGVLHGLYYGKSKI